MGEGPEGHGGDPPLIGKDFDAGGATGAIGRRRNRVPAAAEVVHPGHPFAYQTGLLDGLGLERDWLSARAVELRDGTRSAKLADVDHRPDPNDSSSAGFAPSPPVTALDSVPASR